VSKGIFSLLEQREKRGRSGRGWGCEWGEERPLEPYSVKAQVCAVLDLASPCILQKAHGDGGVHGTEGYTVRTRYTVHGYTNRSEQEADSVSTPSVIVPSLRQERVQEGARVQSHEL